MEEGTDLGRYTTSLKKCAHHEARCRETVSEFALVKQECGAVVAPQTNRGLSVNSISDHHRPCITFLQLNTDTATTTALQITLCVTFTRALDVAKTDKI